MSIKRTGGRKPTMGNWRASIWPRANMQYVNVVISMGICIWMHARYTMANRWHARFGDMCTWFNPSSDPFSFQPVILRVLPPTQPSIFPSSVPLLPFLRITRVNLDEPATLTIANARSSKEVTWISIAKDQRSKLPTRDDLWSLLFPFLDKYNLNVRAALRIFFI